MRPRVQALVGAFAQEVDDLITELVEEQVAPIKAALAGLGIGASGTAAKKVKKVKAAKLAQTRPRGVYDHDFQKKIAAKAVKLTPEERWPFARAQGVDKSRLYAWMRKWAGFTRAKAEAEGKGKGKPRKRKFYTEDFKRALVAKGVTLAPGDRQTLLANEGVNPEIFRKWVVWAKQNPG